MVDDRPLAATAETILPLTLFLVLRAFASGTTALTGVEAISNGITAFKEPKSHKAGRTLLIMSTILGTLMLAIAFLARQIGAVPSDTGEALISQLARTAPGDRGLPYLATIVATTLILLMAANTGFTDYPRLAALHAGDGFLPRQLTYQGSRRPGDRITVVVPHFVSRHPALLSRHPWANVLHAQTATWLRLALLFRPDIGITDVPYLVG